MKARIILRRRESILREQMRIVEVDRCVEALARRIDIDNFHIFPHRPWTSRLRFAQHSRERLPAHRKDDVVNYRCLELPGQARVESISTQPAKGRRFDGGCRSTK